MSDVEKKEEQGKPAWLDDLVNSMKSEFNAKFEALESKVNAKPAKEEDDVDFSDVNFGDDEEEAVDTVKMKKSDLQKLLSEIEKKADRKVEEKLSEYDSVKTERVGYDQLAYSKFPFLQRASKEVEDLLQIEINDKAKYIQKRYAPNKSISQIIKEDPRIFFDAASAVATKNPKLASMREIEEDNREYNATHGSFGGTRGAGKKAKTGEITEFQQSLAKKFGLSLDKVKKHLK